MPSKTLPTTPGPHSGSRPPESIETPSHPGNSDAKRLPKRSPEENYLLSQKAAKVRAERAQKSRSCSCRERLDLPAWQELATKHGVYWPNCGIANDRPYVNRLLKALGRSPAWYRAWTGQKTSTPLGTCPRTTTGYILEAHDRNLRWDDQDWPVDPRFVTGVSLPRRLTQKRAAS